jgi:hypothetical protein
VEIFWTVVVVNNVHMDGDAAAVALPNEATKSPRTSVCGLNRKHIFRIIPPAPVPRKLVNWHQKYTINAQVSEVIELLHGIIQRTGIGITWVGVVKCPDMHLVHNQPLGWFGRRVT